MKKITKCFILILSFILCATSFACTKSGSAMDFYAFNTVIHVETHDKPISNETQSSLNQLFNSLSNEFSCNSPQSSVYQLNDANANVEIPFSQNAMEVFALAKELFTFTDGKFSPAVFPLVKLWQFDDYDYPIQDFIPPSDEEIISLLGEKTNFNNVVVNQNSLTVRKTNADVKVDFGGILKGYAVDKAREILISAGHESGYINIGGSSLYLLSVSSLSIRHPRATENMPNIISVKGENLIDVAVSTSGDYEKYHERDGVRYNHLLSTTTGYPTDTGIVSATVIGGTGVFGDAVTTAICLTEHQVGLKISPLIVFINKILTKYPDCMVFAVYDKGGEKEIITNKKQGEDFTLLDDSYLINEI